MTSPHIRLARPTDDAALARIDRETWSPLHAVVPRPQPPYDPFFDCNHRPADFLVAEIAPTGAGEAGGTAGTGHGAPAALRTAGYLRLVPPTPLACNAHVRQIQGLAVAEWARGRGVARALLRASFDEARRQGATRMTLRVLGHNEPARTLYTSEGFVVEGVLPGEFHLDGRYVDDILMGRDLTGGPGSGGQEA
ncbi:GNAT family N-acetyltransferase [Streptomyces sp. SP18CS02]|uniref:GNAT family N-acetyltransferase n=1 Tax=Streptomyces sp. SP18CS02 TaxID=3002531 RepID=UPI002E7A2041|nr:GNAT family N-acetyltransferase [Streptomyces sp. SP18CS02]MEE1755174.1 GNAT family N-acetyltransferase [Streptomyces sp. SP18CS02]